MHSHVSSRSLFYMFSMNISYYASSDRVLQVALKQCNLCHRVVKIILLNMKSLYYQHLYMFGCYFFTIYLRRRQIFYCLSAELKNF